MICPTCKGDTARRSRRQTVQDYVLSMTGVYPWRCKVCSGRFHARNMSLSETLHAHCPICGNPDLKRISPEYVDEPLSSLWRFLHVPAYRCEPCRHKYFSIRPRSSEAVRVGELSSAD